MINPRYAELRGFPSTSEISHHTDVIKWLVRLFTVTKCFSIMDSKAKAHSIRCISAQIADTYCSMLFYCARDQYLCYGACIDFVQIISTFSMDTQWKSFRWIVGKEQQKLNGILFGNWTDYGERISNTIIKRFTIHAKRAWNNQSEDGWHPGLLSTT